MLTRRTMVGGAIGAAAVPAILRRARAQGGTSAVQTVRIGVLGDQSGVYRDLSGPVAIAAVQQAVAEFAPQGVVADVISADHQNKPDIGAGIARKWIDEDGVDMIIDCPNSAVALAVAGVCRDKDRVFIDSAAATDELTGKQCAATTVHWTMDTWMLAHSTGGALVKQGGDTWFFITADYAFGHTLQADTAQFVQQAGGKVLGSVLHPFPGTTDFSSYLLQAQASGAKVVGLCNAGNDTVNSIKQAGEFGLTQAGITLAGLLVFISDVHALGLKTAQGLAMTTSFYWDANDRTRAFTSRLLQRTGDVHPGMGHAGCYAATLHYLKAVKALGVEAAKKSGAATVARMKAMPTEDDAFGPGSIRPDGRTLHPAFLYQVKTPAESKAPWDYCKLLTTTPAEQAFRPLDAGGCKLIHA